MVYVYAIINGKFNGGEMRSVAIYNPKGVLILKIIQRKNGEYEMSGDHLVMRDLDIDVRDNQNKKVIFDERKEK